MTGECFRNFAIPDNVFLQRDSENTGNRRKRKASVETPAWENFSYDNHFIWNEEPGWLL